MDSKIGSCDHLTTFLKNEFPLLDFSIFYPKSEIFEFTYIYKYFPLFWFSSPHLPHFFTTQPCEVPNVQIQSQGYIFSGIAVNPLSFLLCFKGGWKGGKQGNRKVGNPLTYFLSYEGGKQGNWKGGIINVNGYVVKNYDKGDEGNQKRGKKGGGHFFFPFLITN